LADFETDFSIIMAHPQLVKYLRFRLDNDFVKLINRCLSALAVFSKYRFLRLCSQRRAVPWLASWLLVLRCANPVEVETRHR
jgi:hypothetical protein